MTNVSFDSTNINSGNYTVRKVLHDTATERDLYLYELTREGGSELVNTEWKSKKIIVEGTIQGATLSELETNIDTFKKLMSGENKNLDIAYETGTRRYIATATVIQIERDFYHLNYAPYSVQFTIPSGSGLATTATTHGTVSIELGTLETDIITIEGTKIPKYNIAINFITADTVSEVELMINGDAIKVSETITAGQVLVIDAENKKCTIDGVEKRYDGLFPRLILGDNSYKLITKSVSHQYNVLITYTKAYL